MKNIAKSICILFVFVMQLFFSIANAQSISIIEAQSVAINKLMHYSKTDFNINNEEVINDEDLMFYNRLLK